MCACIEYLSVCHSAKLFHAIHALKRSAKFAWKSFLQTSRCLKVVLSKVFAATASTPSAWGTRCDRDRYGALATHYIRAYKPNMTPLLRITFVPTKQT